MQAYRTDAASIDRVAFKLATVAFLVAGRAKSRVGACFFTLFSLEPRGTEASSIRRLTNSSILAVAGLRAVPSMEAFRTLVLASGTVASRRTVTASLYRIASGFSLTLTVECTVQSVFPSWTRLFTGCSGEPEVASARTGHRVAVAVAASAFFLTTGSEFSFRAHLITGDSGEARRTTALSGQLVAFATVLAGANLGACGSKPIRRAWCLAFGADESGWAGAPTGRFVAHSTILALAGFGTVGSEPALDTSVAAPITNKTRLAVAFSGDWVALGVGSARA